MTDFQNGIASLAEALQPLANTRLAPVEPPKPDVVVDEFEEDFALVRTETKALIEKSKTALENISMIAEQTDDVKAFDSVAKLIRTTGDLTKRLMEAHQTRRQVGAQGPKAADDPAGPVTNVYIGTRKDLLDLLKENRKKKLEDTLPVIEAQAHVQE